MSGTTTSDNQLQNLEEMFISSIDEYFPHFNDEQRNELLDKSINKYILYNNKGIDITIEEAIISSSGGMYNEGY